MSNQPIVNRSSANYTDKGTTSSMFDTQSLKINSLISSIIGKVDYSGIQYIHRYSTSWLLDILNGDKLSLIESKFKLYDKKGVDIVDFVKILLECFEHKQEETIYIVLSLVDLFKGIGESMSLKEYVKFRDFTGFIVDVSAQHPLFYLNFYDFFCISDHFRT